MVDPTRPSNPSRPVDAAAEDDPVRRTVAALREAALAAQRFRDAISDHYGIGTTDLALLSCLMCRARVGPTALAGLLGLTTGSVTPLVDRMERRGFVERRPDPHDRRRSVVELTEAGRQVIGTGDRLLAATLRGIPADDLLSCSSVLGTVSLRLDAQAPALPPRPSTH